MKKFFKEKTQIQWFCLLGIVAVIFYFLHVWIGRANYPGYDPLSQAVSDLTADSAPSQKIASSLSGVSAIFNVTFSVVLCLFISGKMNRVFRLGIYSFTVMNILSGVGYSLFPLSESGYAGTFQDVMHMVVTMGVVLLTIMAFILLFVGFVKTKEYKVYKAITLVSLILLFVGSIATGAVPKEYFGVAERISVYVVILYGGVLSLFSFLYPKEKLGL